MIICVSRRTDVPAFHSEWFMNRLRAGYVMVRNPACKTVVYRIDLDPRNVDCFVFVTKNPEPMEKHLAEIGDLGYKSLFQVTITPYGRDIEPNVPDIDPIVDSFIRISDIIGKENMLWRYDPVIFGDGIDIDFHRAGFERLCESLEGHVNRCVFSFLDLYAKFNGHTSTHQLRNATVREMMMFAQAASRIAGRHGIELTSCCTVDDLSAFGIAKKGCMDSATMRDLGIPYETMQSPLREGCRCVKNIDIGAYDTCRHDCIYCYANSVSSERRSLRTYDPGAEMLFGNVTDADTVISLKSKRVARITDF